jgi:hypothetical protein
MDATLAALCAVNSDAVTFLGLRNP